MSSHCGCGCGCSHHHDHHENHSHNMKSELIRLVVAIGFLIGGVLFQRYYKILSIIAFLVSYLMLGIDILKTAFRNHENLLMSIATVAAIAIGEYPEAVCVMLFFRIGAFFEEQASLKSRKEIMKVVDLRPETVQIVQSHGCHIIPAKDAKVGDVILVRAGERIPLDGMIEEGVSTVDTAPITGESLPINVVEGDRTISGCINLSGVLKIRVEKSLQDSMVTRILHSVEHATANKPRMDRFITRFARGYTPFIVILAVLTAVIPSAITGDWQKWVYTAITFLVISCPCALVLSIPLTFFAGIGLASQKGILLKGGNCMEALQQVKTVVMDKTGTITKGKFEVQKCETYGLIDENELLGLAAGLEMQSTHPIAKSIVEEAKKRSLRIVCPNGMEEIAGKGVCAYVDGKRFLCGSMSLLRQYGLGKDFCAEQAYDTEVFVAADQEVLGRILIADSLKEDSKTAISLLKAKKMKTIVLTGDAKESAEKVAEEIGIDEVYAKLLPEEKLRKMEQIRCEYGKVLYVGDGINDAPVLAGADVGAAMGNGADAAIEAADVVFMTSQVTAIPEAMRIARCTIRIARQNVIFALGVKGAIMILGLLGFANMWLAVFADTGAMMLCVLNSVRILRRK